MPITLLLADDSVVIQKLVGLSFANEDIEIVTVDNGDDAVTRAIECKPDVILADVVMPGMSGYEVCSAIRSNPDLADTPVLLLTGTFEAFDEGRASDVGATGHITKPFEAQVLVDRVTEILAQRQAAPEAPAPAADGDFFDENVAGSEAAASADSTPAEASAAQSFAFGTSTTAEPTNHENEPLTSPLDGSGAENVGAETVAMVSGPDLSDLLDGAGGDRTIAIMPESFGENLLDDSPAVDSPEAAVGVASEVATSDPGQTVLVDDFLGSPGLSSDSSLIGAASPEASENDPTGTAIGSMNLNGAPAPSPTAPTDSPTAPLKAEAADISPDAVTDNDSLDLDGLSFASQPAMPAVDIDSPDGDETVLGKDLFATGPNLDTNLGDSLTDPAASGLPPSQGLDIDFAGAPNAESIVPPNANDYDVSASDLNVDLGGDNASWSAGIPAGVQTAPDPISMTPDPTPPAPAKSDTPPLDLSPQSDPEPAPSAPVPDPEASAAGSKDTRPTITPEMSDRINDTLEKVAWEAFSDLSDDIVRQLMKRVEQIAWEVIPQMAETLIRDEIRRMKGEEEGEE